ncbi:MAG TPA: hypothetical protein VNQ56_11915, partial [Pseudolabrys sp.]|nr:hypothetical protein [Pseudolabrys sp.]
IGNEASSGRYPRSKAERLSATEYAHILSLGPLHEQPAEFDETKRSTLAHRQKAYGYWWRLHIQPHVQGPQGMAEGLP